MIEQARVTAVADRMIEAFVTRAGSEDARQILAAFADQEPDGDGQVLALACLAMQLAERAADLSTVYDIWSPNRPVVRAKVERLAALVIGASREWLTQTGKGATNG